LSLRTSIDRIEIRTVSDEDARRTGPHLTRRVHHAHFATSTPYPRALDKILRAYETNLKLSNDSVWILGALELWARVFIDKPAEIAP